MAAVAVAVAAAFLAGSQFPSVSQTVLSTLVSKSYRGVPEQSFPPLNNEGCTNVYTDILDGCEDGLIIGDELFLACGDGPARVDYFPGAGHIDPSGRKDFQEQAFKLNLKSKKIEKLERVGYTGDTIHHGIGEWIFPDDPTKVNLFFVNHIRGASCITIYEHKLGTKTLTLVKNVCHHKILTPNDVAPVGPLQFYISNDHRFRGGIGRYIEGKYGPFSWNEVVYCDASGSDVMCKTAAKGGMEYPNGVIAIDNGAQLLVCDSVSGNVYRYVVNAQTHMLKLEETIKVGLALDNLSRISGSRELTVACFPSFTKLFNVVYHPRDMSIIAPAYSVRINPARAGSGAKSSVKPVYSDDGSKFSAATFFITDDKLDVTYAGSVSRPGLLMCPHALK